MARAKKYDDSPMQYSDHPGIKARIRAIADRENLSMAQVLRELVGMSLARREQMSAQRVAAR